MAELVSTSTCQETIDSEVGADGSGLEKMKSEANLKDGASDLEHFNAFEQHFDAF